ncbi:MAG TPA: hypothetical protein DCL54_05325, partial [Alphaproteobacteria bacterium]|nr:hypothetical protein [Alphaproteobacteria bacterium]
LKTSRSSRVERAFATVPREAFLGRGPWPIYSYPSSYALTATNDPCEVYRDVVVGLIPEMGINNGQPSLHAHCIGLLNPQPAETVVHIGAGGGYYTAILAQLACDGEVHAYEIEPDLAARAHKNLIGFANVRMHAASGVDRQLPSCTAIYVNAGSSQPMNSWLDALLPNGRLIFPMTSESLMGGMVHLAYTKENVFSARIIRPVGFIPCVGARNSSKDSALADAFNEGEWRNVRSLLRGTEPDKTYWFAADDCWFSTRDAAEF